MAKSQYDRPFGFWILCIFFFCVLFPWNLYQVSTREDAIDDLFLLGSLLLFLTNTVILAFPQFTAGDGRPFSIFLAYFVSFSTLAYAVLYAVELRFLESTPFETIGAMLSGSALLAWMLAGLMTASEDHWISHLKPYRLSQKSKDPQPVDPLARVLQNNPKFMAPVYYFPPPPPLPTYALQQPQIIY